MAGNATHLPARLAIGDSTTKWICTPEGGSAKNLTLASLQPAGLQAFATAYSAAVKRPPAPAPVPIPPPPPAPAPAPAPSPVPVDWWTVPGCFLLRFRAALQRQGADGGQGVRSLIDRSTNHVFLTLNQIGQTHEPCQIEISQQCNCTIKTVTKGPIEWKGQPDSTDDSLNSVVNFIQERRKMPLPQSPPPAAPVAAYHAAPAPEVNGRGASASAASNSDGWGGLLAGSIACHRFRRQYVRPHEHALSRTFFQTHKCARCNHQAASAEMLYSCLQCGGESWSECNSCFLASKSSLSATEAPLSNAAQDCTFVRHGASYISQMRQECYTCGLVGNWGVCQPCGDKCHAGHEKSAPSMSHSFYCDCGAKGHGQILTRHNAWYPSIDRTTHRHLSLTCAVLSVPVWVCFCLRFLSVSVPVRVCTGDMNDSGDVVQAKWRCETCPSGQKEICVHCKDRCHAGHNVVRDGVGSFSCACSATGHSCRA
jgi:hypothetical protein